MSDLHPDADPTPPRPDRYFPAPPVPRYVAAPAPDLRQPQYPRPDGQPRQTYRPPFSLGRPGSVTTALTITWVVLAVYGIGLGRFVIAAVADTRGPFQTFEVPHEVSNVFLTFAAVAVVLLAWVAVALVLSVFAFGGRPWARIALAISGGLSVPFQLAASWYLVPLAGAVATIAVIVMLFTGEANDWYARSRSFD